jgi:adenylate cyclase
MLPPKAKRNALRIFPFGIIWFIFSIIYLLLEKGLLGDSPIYPSTGNPYSFEHNFIVTPIASFFGGLIIGAVEILYLSKLFTKRSLGQKVLFKTLIYITFMFTFLFGITLINTSIEIQKSIFSTAVWNNVWVFFTNLAFWSVQIYMAAIIGASLFYAEVSDHLGLGVMHNFLSGKYHHPVEEERIFMFCDMKSSTTIAENLGHVKFFEMLREYYADLSDATGEFAGEIYLYVGDEIIVSWEMKNGLQNNNCLNCFFAMKKALQKQSKKYQEKYGLVPTFKAGFHFGKVTAGEIGVIKKDIMFTGDVLNTTARIQGLCNGFDVDILVSGDLIKRLKYADDFQIKALGESELRGRDEKVELFTLNLRTPTGVPN